MNLLYYAVLHRSQLDGDWLISRFATEFIELRQLLFVQVKKVEVFFHSLFSGCVDKNVYRLPNEGKIVVFISAALAPGELVMAMNIFQCFKHLSGDSALSILRAIEG